MTLQRPARKALSNNEGQLKVKGFRSLSYDARKFHRHVVASTWISGLSSILAPLIEVRAEYLLEAPGSYCGSRGCISHRGGRGAGLHQAAAATFFFQT
jgi:hypothetical protein